MLNCTFDGFYLVAHGGGMAFGHAVATDEDVGRDRSICLFSALQAFHRHLFEIEGSLVRISLSPDTGWPLGTVRVLAGDDSDNASRSIDWALGERVRHIDSDNHGRRQ